MQINFAELVEQAEAEGLTTKIFVGTGFVFEVASVSTHVSQGGKPKISLRMKIVEGPEAGRSFFDNLNLTQDNPKALAVFFRQLATYGVPTEAAAKLSSVEDLAAAIPLGRRYSADLSERVYNGNAYQDVKSVKAVNSGADTQTITPADVASASSLVGSKTPSVPF